MTDKAWVLVSKASVKGYRSMSSVHDNPQWMMIELLNGFGSHKQVLEAHELRAKFIVLSAKEESNTSHTNQGCDQFVTKEDKRKADDNLYTQQMITRSVNNKGGRLKQWDLLYTIITLVRNTTMQMWIALYERVNINPLTRFSFHVWCQDCIAQYLQAGEAFYPEAVHPSAEEMYRLLPEFWPVMTPDQKKDVQAIFPGHDASYTHLCQLQLHEDCNIPYSNMRNVRVCLVLSKDHPQMLDWQMPEKKNFSTVPISDVEDAQKYVSPLNSNLDLFQLGPRGSNRKSKLTGAALFAHICFYRRRILGREGTQNYEGSNHLELSLGKRQMEYIWPTEQKLERGHIIRYSEGDGASLIVARKKLNTIGNMHGHCSLLNGADNLKCMRDDLQLTDAIADIFCGDAEASAAKREEESENLIGGAAVAATKLEEKHWNVSDLTMKEIKTLFFLFITLLCLRPSLEILIMWLVLW